MKSFRSRILLSLFALMFNILAASAMSMATGFNPIALFGAGSALSLMPLSPAGAFGMAVNKEIWMNSIVEGLFASDSFLSKAFNADEFVNAGKTVHIPNAGSGSAVVKNRSSYPASVTSRTDTDLTFNLDEFTTDPIKIPYADQVELSYNKRESVIKQDKATLIEKVANDMIFNWSPASGYTIRTTGSTAVAAHTPSATGNRKAFTKTDVKLAMDNFNGKDIPQEGRYMLVDAVMYGQLLDSLTTQEAMAFHSLVDVKNGVLGKLYTFNIMMRSKAGLYTTAVAPKLWTAAGAATDNAAVLCWHENSVCRALGQTEMFESVKDPLYYADIYSFLVRAGGRAMRSGVEGLLAIVQDTAA
jgi:hypothetical protein